MSRGTTKQRLSGLQVGNHEKLICLGIRSGSVQTEKSLHEHFKYAHKRGEWFYPVQELLHLIERGEQRLPFEKIKELEAIWTHD